MKILVSNFGRQYCNELLVALQRKNLLGVFCTALAANRYHWETFPKLFRQQLRKRVFAGVPPEKIKHFPLLFLLERVFRDRLPWTSRVLGDLFDRRVAARVRSDAYDAVITYENTNRFTMRAAREAGKTTILDLAQIHQEDIVAYARWFMSPEQLREEIEIVNPRKAAALRDTDYVLVLSSFAAESMLRHGWPADRLFTVHLGVDLQRFFIKQQYRSEGPLRLLFVGTMTKRKGLEVLLQAMEYLPKDAVELTLIGPMADARDLLARHAEKFRYRPFLHHEALAEYYQEADVFVFPSLLDSWAQTVVEAMACGTPAIVTENTGAKDAVRQGGGWIIQANDTHALANQIQYCLNHRIEIERRGKQAHAIAKQYTWDSYQNKLIEIIEKIK